MGYSTSWIAVKGVDRRQIAEALGWALSDIPAGGRPIHGVGALPGGWTVAIAPGEQALKAPFLALAKLGPAVACFIEERVMCSEARGFEDGVEAWRISHDPEKGVLNLDVTGSPPPAFAVIRDRLAAEQAEIEAKGEPVDLIFDAPALVTQALQPPRRPGLLARLFGRA